MSSLPEISIKRPVFAWMLMAAIMVFGGLSFYRLGISQLPDVDFPVVGVSLSLPPVEKTTKQEVYMVIHRSSFAHKKIEFDEFLEPKDKRYTQEEFEWLLSIIEKKINKQKEEFAARRKELAELTQKGWSLKQISEKRLKNHVSDPTLETAESATIPTFCL